MQTALSLKEGGYCNCKQCRKGRRLSQKRGVDFYSKKVKARLEAVKEECQRFGGKVVINLPMRKA